MEKFNSVTISSEAAGPEAPAPVTNPIEATPPAAPVEATRPSWLPEKFKSAEDLAKAYSALESKLGSSGEEKPSQPDEKPADPLAIKPTEPAPDNDSFVDKFSEEFMSNGKLSDESYQALASKGYSKKMVDGFIAGQQAILQQSRNQIFKEVGGENTYNEIISWASQNLSKGEIEAYNKAVSSQDWSSIQFAVNGLKARFDGNKSPKLVQGQTGNTREGFASRAELAKAVSDPRYKNDPAYRRKVEEKLSVSRFS
jgi:hypothetical protein